MGGTNRAKLKSFPLSRVYGLMETGPVVLLTTFQNDQPDVMAMSWHTMLDFEPPLIGCVVGQGGHTFKRLKATKECVIAIPTLELSSLVVGVGNCSGRNRDKFSEFGIATLPASRVKAPLLSACYANLECVVVDMSLMKKYNFFILKTVKAWINPAIKNPKTLHHQGWGRFMVAGKTIQLPSKMR